MSEALSPTAFQDATGINDRVLDRCRVYLDLLQRWQPTLNLVGPTTLSDPWRRHLLDSAQLLPILPTGTERLVDLGSGAGLPGLVLAILGVPTVRLVESDRRKAVFLREAVRALGLSVEVVAERIERQAPWRADAVTARALASLTKLLAYAQPFVGAETRCVFLKGARARDELTEARLRWTMEVAEHPSRTDPAAMVLEIWNVQER